MIGEAAAFADKAHKGAFRKGTMIPYITHPMETAVIVSAFTDDEEIIAAAKAALRLAEQEGLGEVVEL